ncbi:hypothetical protein PoB_002355400 [Plakobranchus ocellatus]|uniref:AIG1-type G domain-containing protein n=1 Tax=Plakobranchus ocellatus TaxID=259542 RepID=A0AAV3ZP11_9GAST|nr:hypothetical protein PoB_002355400 [Plakobranchus ocellatus]
MTKAELVLVIFGLEELDGYFESMLVFLRDVMVKSEENRSPPQVLVAITDKGATFPSSVTEFKKIQITDVMESLNEYEKWHHQQEADVLNEASNNERINACVENMISFFCSLLSISWPLAT